MALVIAGSLEDNSGDPRQPSPASNHLSLYDWDTRSYEETLEAWTERPTKPLRVDGKDAGRRWPKRVGVLMGFVSRGFRVAAIGPLLFLLLIHLWSYGWASRPYEPRDSSQLTASSYSYMSLVVLMALVIAEGLEDNSDDPQ
ncbi:hypothetical protein BKA70DRAFT_1440368 [Coprinopsis sp. MPI-PUGE-AT-0042]|nr:hypothetical protein BKA70DRAFT_1440368 [Coprinopsis sp. MPI-PUGE-AT-0042]